MLQKFNCFRCHGENHGRVWWTFNCKFKTSNAPTVADSPGPDEPVSGIGVFLGNNKTKN